ncbi:diphthine--ammonia ligase [Chloroflexota bacterium]
MNPAFISWSGGKDCCLAGYLATQNGLDARYLVNTVSEDGSRSRSHGISVDVIRAQAQVMDIPLIQQPTGKDDYEANFINVLRKLKQEGINDGVFGDIDFNAHLEWIERVCKKSGMTPHLPLWEMSQKKIMEDFIKLGFVSVVVAVKPDPLGKEWLGRKLDDDFLNELEKLGDKVTLCGEKGEYHSLVIDGPLFKKRLEIIEAEKVIRDGRWFLDIHRIELKGK